MTGLGRKRKERNLDSSRNQSPEKSRTLPFSLPAAVLIVIAMVAGITLAWRQRAEAPDIQGLKAAKIGSQNVALEVSDTPKKRQQGLSGRQFLPKYQGMLFDFELPGRHCIWMKDMNFNLDIIWADSDKTVTHIEPEVSPQTYPRTFCGGLSPSRYVIELNSGAAAEAGLKAGDKISF